MDQPLIAHRHRLDGLALAFLVALLLAPHVPAQDNPAALAQRIQQLDQRNEGNLGVYIKHLGSGETVRYQADRHWYLASTIKVPLAVAVLQAVEAGEMSLDDRLELARSDFVDGAGDLLWYRPGSRFSIVTLLEKSITNSDSTATDILMRHLGVETFNRRIREGIVATGFAPLTTILQVRYQAYGELHPRASQLSNMDYIEIRSAGAPARRVEAFRDKLELDADQLNAPTLTAAFHRYYERDLNSATLTAFGRLLERLVQGELLNSAHTRLLLGYMQNIATGDNRLQAGLPDEVPLAQKTGTQIARACNMGVAYPREPANAVVIAVCIENFHNITEAEQTFQAVAVALGRAEWL